MQKWTRDLKKKELFVLFLSLFLLAIMAVVTMADVGEAKDIELTVKWDPDVIELDEATGLPINTAWENLGFFYRIDDGAYDYSSPALLLPQTYVDDRSEPSETPLTITVPDDVVSTAYIVVRSQATVEGKSVNSEDSNEAMIEIDLTGLAPFEFSAAYNDVTNSIDFSWAAVDPRVKQWAVYVGDQSGGPWTELTRVDYSETATSISIPSADMFPPGKMTTKWFTMVAFGAYDVFSANAPEVSVVRDGRDPARVVNLKVFLTE